MAEERLQKIISRAGLMSRREAEKFILAGRVTVDGKIISELGAKADADRDKICVDGRELNFSAEKIYILLNKPRGVISSAKDDRGRRTVVDLVQSSERIFPVGRLDFDSEGLILLTNDGELMNKLLHPKFKIEKTYRVKFSGEVTDEKLNLLRAGIELDDGPAAPAEVFLLSENVAEITIHEGRNRQVRRMFAAVGLQVKNLCRTKFANLTIKNLPRGSFRKLTAGELKLLFKLAGI